MVLDSGTQAYEQAPPSLSVSPPTVSGVRKISNQNGPQLYPSLQPPMSAPSSRKPSPVVPVPPRPSVSQPSGLASSRPKVSSPTSEIRQLSSASQGRGRIRRSESSCSIRGSSGKGRLRPASSLPHIAKSKVEEIRAAGKSPCLLVALRPNNLEQERDRFFQSRYTYNPQFEYEEPVPTAVLEKYNEASDKFIPQAVRIIEAVLEKYGSYEQFEAITGGQLLTKCQIWSIVRKYMQKEGCSGEVVVQLSEDLLSQAVMMVENSRPTLAINLTGARQYWLEGMLRHEIGTHYLRFVNNTQQPWNTSDGRRQYGLRPANPTEEGLASLHSVLFRKQPFLWRAALLYYTIQRAALMSFRQLFQDLAQYVQDTSVRWEYCVRAKRGQKDTSKPGCFSKDQVYLDGILRILRHRQKIDFHMLTALGKVSYEDVNQLRPHGKLEKTRIPHFMQDLTRYHQQLEHIIITNRLDDAQLDILLPD
ncbi:microtubule-associated tyrosine carboxypeptidase 1 [Antechinus flavipes]|uniref:microtubule-associated tyrosine carboxypeptidase 1 n=1 Tax=Antechinus flavipes TaxID=38775 RepID=UPI0022368C0C|nr:microtubule-associated tyrosine carboxypeptidase 1 [Antechinus flavipes]XP_051830991.1 microtubule-associated tyrosine carboxypeptidase 1 [Antechinus flavipes]XP_051830993.1 microtubule-associated tyrosine carboxypeptidase 1 [Antechinus flavipes]